jgi:cyd operon protein YbgE
MTSGLLRLISLLLAAIVSLMILVYPPTLISADGTSQHGMLMIVLMGACIGFVHGVGFRPQHLPWRIVFSPWAGWPPMLAGLFIMLTE